MSSYWALTSVYQMASSRSKAPSLTKFSSYKPAAMKISELEKKKYRV